MSYWKSKNISKQRPHDQASEICFHAGLTHQHLITRDLLLGLEQVSGTGEGAEKVSTHDLRGGRGGLGALEVGRSAVIRGDRDQPLRSLSVALSEAPRAPGVLGLGKWSGRSCLGPEKEHGEGPEPWVRIASG